MEVGGVTGRETGREGEVGKGKKGEKGRKKRRGRKGGRQEQGSGERRIKVREV